MIAFGYTAAQIRAAEAPLLSAGEPLMQRAAAGLAAEIGAVLTDLPPRLDGGPRRVLALVGSGNNGGDALFAAAELARGGVDVTAVATADRVHAEAGSAATSAGVVFAVSADLETVVALATQSDVIVDGILGTGTGAADRAALRDRARDVVAALLPLIGAKDRPRVVAVDLPSGVSPDDGALPDLTVLPADVTVTFGALKAGLLLDPARHLVGRIMLVDIGLGPQLTGVAPLVSVETPRTEL